MLGYYLKIVILWAVNKVSDTLTAKKTASLT